MKYLKCQYFDFCNIMSFFIFEEAPSVPDTDMAAKRFEGE